MLSHQFCAVFRFGSRLYLAREADALGPRKLLLPPEELPSDISDTDLTEAVYSALNDFHSIGRSIYADEWKTLNSELIEYFDVSSVSEFERKKSGVTIRKDTESGEVCIFRSDGSGGEIVVCDSQIGSRIRELLGLIQL